MAPRDLRRPTGWLEQAVSPALRRTVTDLGAAGERWLERVPALVTEVAEAWELEVGQPLAHRGCASIILPVATARGVPAVLKLSVPHDESRHDTKWTRYGTGAATGRSPCCGPRRTASPRCSNGASQATTCGA
jgi:streptomycin 6-kinase